MPMNFESMYPVNCEITKTVFSPNPNNCCCSNMPAVKGLRNAYMQKYVQNAAIAASRSRDRVAEISLVLSVPDVSREFGAAHGSISASETGLRSAKEAISQLLT